MTPRSKETTNPTPRNHTMASSDNHSPESFKRRQIISKQTVKDTGDDEEHTSAHKVGSIDDLLIKILTGLPLRSLPISISVCKHWSSLITDPNFTLLRTQNPNADHPQGLFLMLQSTSQFTFVPLDCKGFPLIKSFPFNPNPNSGFIQVLHSCNGLLLCHIWPDKLYVFNPTVNKYKMLPLPHTWIKTRFINGMVIAFDPKVSSHYKVIYPREDFNDPDMRVHLEIYSSETGNWSVCGRTFSLISFLMFSRGVVYWRDACHWMDNLEIYHFNCDIKNPNFMQVENPRILNGTDYGLNDKLLVSSCDCLLLVKMVEFPSMLKIDVYEMKDNCYSGWSVRYHIDLLRANLNILTANFNLPSGPKYNVLSVVIGKGDEDSFLVLEVTWGKVVKYNIFSKTFHEPCDVTLFQLRDTKVGYFWFTLSLAGV